MIVGFSMLLGVIIGFLKGLHGVWNGLFVLAAF